MTTSTQEQQVCLSVFNVNYAKVPFMCRNQRYSDPATPMTAAGLPCSITTGAPLEAPLGLGNPFGLGPLPVVGKMRDFTVMGSVPFGSV